MDIDKFVKDVEDFIKVEKECSKYPFPYLLERKENLKNKITKEINKYNKGKYLEEQGFLFSRNAICFAPSYHSR